MTKKQIYFAAPLFSKADQMFNAEIAGIIRGAFPEYKIYVPQEHDEINDKDKSAKSTDIALYDTKELLKSRLMIAVLDGGQIDPGVAAEVGIAYQNKIPVVAYYTDCRQYGTGNAAKVEALQNETVESQFAYVNLFVVGLVKMNGCVVNNKLALINAIDDFVCQDFQKLYVIQVYDKADANGVEFYIENINSCYEARCNCRYTPLFGQAAEFNKAEAEVLVKALPDQYVGKVRPAADLYEEISASLYIND